MSNLRIFRDLAKTVIALSLCFALASCGTGGEDPVDSDGSVTGTNRPSDGVIQEQKIDENHVLMELDSETGISYFAIYNEEKDSLTELPTRPDAAELEEVVDANQVVLRMTGVNSESAGRWFPSRAIFTRADENAEFERVVEPVCFELTETITAGVEIPCTLSDAVMDEGAVTLTFTKAEGDKGALFTADYTKIPLTTISFDDEKQMLEIDLKDCVIREGLKETSADLKISEESDGCKVFVKLADGVKGYYADEIVAADGDEIDLMLQFVS